MSKMYLWNIGLLSVPDGIDEIFSSDGKFLISPTLKGDFLFEMSGESMYYALIDSEKSNNANLAQYKNRILEAIIRRINTCNGKLFHNSLSGVGVDTQLRSSSAAIRILIEAIKDGFNDFTILSNLVNYHYQFFFKWANGIWFCHDTSEYNGDSPKSHLKTRVLNTEPNNTLTLNTHFDSLSTLLLLEQYSDKLNLSFVIHDYVVSAMNSLKSLLNVNANQSSLNKCLQQIDCKLLNYNLIHNSIFTRTYERIIHPILFKVLSPTIFFDYGFIGRDLAVLNRHIDYHIVNMVDIARVLCLLRSRSDFSDFIDLYDSYKHILGRGIEIAQSVPNYKKYIYNGELNIAWLCELSILLEKLQIKCPFRTDNYPSPKYNPFIY